MLSHNVDEITSWLRERLAAILGIQPDSVAVDCPLSMLGLDSLQVMSLFGEAEDFLDCRLPEDAVSDAMTIEQLSAAFSASAREVHGPRAKDGSREP